MRGSEQTMDRTLGYLGLVPIGVLGWAADRLGGAPAMAARSAGSEICLRCRPTLVAAIDLGAVAQ
jgi:hypothetical protein